MKQRQRAKTGIISLHMVNFSFVRSEEIVDIYSYIYASIDVG